MGRAKYAIKCGWKAQEGYIRSHSHRLKVRALTPNFTAASRCRMAAKKRFFLRCWPKVVGSLAIGKLRVQTGAISLRATVTLRSQKGHIAHAGRKDAGRIQEFATRNPKLSRADSAINLHRNKLPKRSAKCGLGSA